MAASQIYPNREFWVGKRVLVTGHTGFKGAWLSLWLHRLGAQVTGIALPPVTTPNLFNLAGVANITKTHMHEIRDAAGVTAIMRATDPDIVFHLAAQPLVLAGYTDPLETFSSNVMGTAHVLEAARTCTTVRTVVVVTTDKVYENPENAYPFRETDPLGGHDPYSASKAAAEIVVASYRSSFLKDRGVGVATARAGNVIGGGDWAADRLIPDAVRAWGAGQPLMVRRPNALRPWQHVLEPLAAYLRLAECLHHTPALADSYNFGPAPHAAATVRTVVTYAQRAFGRGDIRWDDGNKGQHESGWLALETAKARHRLSVGPRWGLHTGVARTMAWYRRVADGADAAALCHQDIAAFETDAPVVDTPDGKGAR